MSKVVCIYHANCFDGICSAWVVSRVYPQATFIPYAYGDPVPIDLIEQDDKVIMVDISFKRNEMENLKNWCNDLLVLDHHKTAQANCEGLDFCKFDMNESGASLAWRHYFPNEPLPALVKYVADRDLWRFKEPYSEEINAYIQSYPMTILDYEWLYKELEFGMDRVVVGGQSISRYKSSMTKAICKQVAVGHVGYDKSEVLVPIVNTSLLFSEVGHELCKLYPGYPYAAYYYDRLNSGTRQWGLRSIGDFDVSEVAKRFGGGGHKNAAGFEQRLDEF